MIIRYRFIDCLILKLILLIKRIKDDVSLFNYSFFKARDHAPVRIRNASASIKNQRPKMLPSTNIAAMAAT